MDSDDCCVEYCIGKKKVVQMFFFPVEISLNSDYDQTNSEGIYLMFV